MSILEGMLDSPCGDEDRNLPEYYSLLWKLTALWVIRDLAIQRPGPDNVRCYSDSGQRRVRSDCPLCARSGHHPAGLDWPNAKCNCPDYAWWHGIYEVAKTFYMQFIPEMKQVAGEPLATELLEKYVYTQPGHRWLKEGMTKEQLQKIQEFYRGRYGEQGDKK
jgi:hypothetical protein